MQTKKYVKTKFVPRRTQHLDRFKIFCQKIRQAPYIPQFIRLEKGFAVHVGQGSLETVRLLEPYCDKVEDRLLNYLEKGVYRFRDEIVKYRRFVFYNLTEEDIVAEGWEVRSY